MILTPQAWMDSRAGTYVNWPVTVSPDQSHQCVALFWDYNTYVAHNEPYSAPGAADLWGYPWVSYDKTHTPVTGDWASWSGSTGPYQNLGAGHVAMFVSDNGNGTGQFFSQNPNAAQVMTLSLDGIQGFLRMKPLSDDELFLRALDVQLP